ncbi:Fic family protein [Pseudomonas mosselii]|uniref:Fic family protein n=1 Tax=Pseudomonas mosselii TaxID=78327 RepID=UPI0021DA401F|nr:Fic family protein [Pseudomonas mosselii]MCU9527557.1 Fic family protein [Pseudomonas mosselii]MCU9534870.1 Fic family protein [Pseudomonas mosselii]MCU9542373.1 Fic family protein [Pseudomonas mosselii]MCU9546710.1 Fic family protein [Pseudomonas mosselii]
MAIEFIQGKHWLEPLSPSGGYPSDVLEMADELPYLLGRLEGAIPPETAKRVGHLMRLTNSYYSNLIEGQFTEPATLAPRLKVRVAKDLRLLAVTHIVAQESLERLLRRFPDITWKDMFSRNLVSNAHKRLFNGAAEKDLDLGNGRMLVPGQLRDDSQQNVFVGDHAAPGWESVGSMINRMQEAYGMPHDPRTRLLNALAYHHRLAFTHPFEDGNGRLIRMMTHLQLVKIGLGSPLWSLSRGLAKHQDEYYARLRAADQVRRGDLDGRGQLTQAGLVDFVRFMLKVCKDQITYTTDAMSVHTLRDRLERIVRFDPHFVEAGIKPGAARALHLLLIQGEVTRADFKVYLGLPDRASITHLKALIDIGVVEAPSPKSRELHPGLPIWFAQLVFPDLHRRFS